MRADLRLGSVLFLAALAVAPAQAARITVVNLDGAGTGLNDPTVVAAVTGNPATTVGGQRLNVLEAASNYWASRLASEVEIRMDANMEPLPCNSSSAVLGSAGPLTASQDFPNAPTADTWYPIALANALARFDISASSDIVASFNSDVDNTSGCLDGVTWYYGIGADAPAGTISLYDTVLHELGHGLGFSIFVNTELGTELNGDPDIFESHLEDHSLGLMWPAMTNGQRAASAIDTGDLHWVGPAVANVCQNLDDGQGTGDGTHVDMYAPNPFEGGSSVAHWDTSAAPDELMEPNATPTSMDALTRALFEDLGWRGVELVVRSAGDVDGDQTEDVAVLAPDLDNGFNLVLVYSGADGSELSRIFFPTAFSAKGMEVLPSFAGTSANEVAVLLHNPTTGENQILVKDLSSGALLNTIKYATALYVIEMEVVPDFGGTAAPEIALLVRERSGGRLNRVMVKDASSGALLQTLYVSGDFVSFDVEVVSDFGGTSAPELAILSRRCNDEIVRVDTRDASSAALLSRIFFATGFVPLDLEILPDTLAGGGTTADELVVLARRASDGFVKVRIKDASNGVELLQVNYPSNVDPLDLEVMQSVGGNPAADIAVLGRRPSNGFTDVKIKDGFTGILLEQLVFADNRLPYDLGIVADMDGGGDPEAAVITFRVTDGEKRLPVKDALGTLLHSIPVP